MFEGVQSFQVFTLKVVQGTKRTNGTCLYVSGNLHMPVEAKTNIWIILASCQGRGEGEGEEVECVVRCLS
jgi:hypothetical protein